MKTLFFASLFLCGALASAAPDLNRYFAVETEAERPLNIRVLSDKKENGIRITSIKFDGGLIDGHPSTCFAWYTRPDGPGPFPGVIKIHGAGLRKLEPDLRFPQQGFACISIDWAGNHAKRIPPTSEFHSTEALAVPAGKNQKWKIGKMESNRIRIGVIFARRALEFLRSRPEIDRNSLFTVGSSAGAHLSLLLLGYEQGIKAAVVKYGTAFIRDLPGCFGGYFGPIYLCSKPDQDLWLSYLDPKHGIRNYRQRILLLSGTDDIFFWMPAVLHTQRNMPGEKRLLMRPNDNHQWVGNDPVSALFFRSAMKPSLDWPEVSAPIVTVRNGTLSVTGTVRSSAKLRTVSLVYKTMPRPFQYHFVKNHPWKQTDMKLSGNVWTADIPAPLANEQTVAYILVKDIDGRMASGDTAEIPVWPRWRGK